MDFGGSDGVFKMALLTNTRILTTQEFIAFKKSISRKPHYRSYSKLNNKYECTMYPEWVFATDVRAGLYAAASLDILCDSGQ